MRRSDFDIIDRIRNNDPDGYERGRKGDAIPFAWTIRCRASRCQYEVRPLPLTNLT